MTIQFMVLGAPRSATTWASNWLTTEKTLCLHDSLLTFSEDELDSIPCDRVLGLSCTALPLLTEFVNDHPARKVILHRERRAIDASLVGIGLTPLSRRWDGVLEKIKGEHVDFMDVFEPTRAKAIYEFLTQLPFDEARHEQLSQMYVEPAFDRVHVKADRALSFRRKVETALRAVS